MISNEYINQAIDYILMHINENITVDEIAAYCNFSRYYFTRMFKLETGESIGAFIKRAKLEQSAFRLKIEEQKSITDVGQIYGYSASNYSSAFKQHHELSPLHFRRSILQKSLNNPIFDNTAVKLDTFAECSGKISVEILPDYSVIFERHKGNYCDLSNHWGAFQEKHRDLITKDTLLLERTYDDPCITKIDECLYDLYMTVPAGYQDKNTYQISGGKFAIYHYKGLAKQIYSAYQSFFYVWLPQSRYEIDERFGLEIYRKVDCESMRMEIDICFPVK